MAEQTYQSLPIKPSQSPEKQDHPASASSPGPSSASDEKSTSSNPPRRRKQSSMSPGNMGASGPSGQPNRQRQKAKALPTRGRGESSRGLLMAMPGVIDQEITYTPTTHRISKAKKGKKVHACEFPGCNKIFTRAEHRKRHEANHNTSPAFQCEIEGCKKPFQRADLLARHMERQHNMPSAEASAVRSQYRQGSTSEASSPVGASIGAPHMPQQAPLPASSLPQASGTMSIGSIIEPNMHRSTYDSHPGGQSLHDLSHAPIGTAPRSLLPEFFYGLSPSGDSLYSSSDSCYSPNSDYLQPQAVPQPYYPPDIIRRPQSASLETWGQPIMQHSPLSAAPVPSAWNDLDPTDLGFVPEAQYLPSQRPYAYHSPSWPGTHSIPPYQVDIASQQPFQWTKVNF